MKKQVYLSNKQILSSINRLSGDINQYCKIKGYDEITVLTVMNGGMIFAGHIIPKLRMKCKLDYCQVSRYGDNEVGDEIVHWKVYPNLEHVRGKVVLILDDIFDEGYTLEAVKKYIKDNGGIPIIAVLFDKIRDCKTDLKVDFVGTIISNKFVFGFGLDIKGYERNLPDLWYIE